MPSAYAADFDDMDQAAFDRFLDWQDGDTASNITIHDLKNMTEERYAKLRYLVEHRALPNSNIDGNELVDKLRVLQQQRATTPAATDRSPSPTIEEDAESFRTKAYRNCEELIRLGGRPSAPIQTNPGVWDITLCDEGVFVYRHWRLESRRTEEELLRWQSFRRFQEHRRESTESVKAYKETLRKFGLEESMPYAITLSTQIPAAGKQDQFSEWNEYIIWELGWLRKRETRQEAWQKLLDAAKPGSKDEQLLEQNLSRVHGEINERKLRLEWAHEQLRHIVAEAAPQQQQRPEQPREQGAEPDSLNLHTVQGACMQKTTESATKRKKSIRLADAMDFKRGRNASDKAAINLHTTHDVRIQDTMKPAARRKQASQVLETSQPETKSRGHTRKSGSKLKSDADLHTVQKARVQKPAKPAAKRKLARRKSESKGKSDADLHSAQKSRVQNAPKPASKRKLESGLADSFGKHTNLRRSPRIRDLERKRGKLIYT